MRTYRVTITTYLNHHGVQEKIERTYTMQVENLAARDNLMDELSDRGWEVLIVPAPIREVNDVMASFDKLVASYAE